MERNGTARITLESGNTGRWSRILAGLKLIFTIVSTRNLSGYAQMIAYNVLFATAPLLILLTAGAAAITRWLNSAAENPAVPVLDWMQRNLPAETAAFLKQPIESAVNAPAGWLFSAGAILALWGARGAVSAVMNGLNSAYGIQRDPRPWVQQVAISLFLMLLMVLQLGLCGLAFTLGTDLGDRIASGLSLGEFWSSVSGLVQRPLLAVMMVLVVLILHQLGPAVVIPWSAYLPGAAFTVIGMYVATVVLGNWFARGSSYSEAYGVFGSVLAFVFWLYVMGFVILLGGAINSALHQMRTAS